MAMVLVVYLVVTVGVTLWAMLPPERAYGTHLLRVLASGVLWPLLMLSLIVVALLFWVFPEMELRP